VEHDGTAGTGEPGEVEVTFYGVRGSTPCASPEVARYGGNTSCVTVTDAGFDPIVFDMGTGLRPFGSTQPADGTFSGTALVSHLHWDHVQGLPFFTPILRSGAFLRVYAPWQEHGTVRDAFDRFVREPYFPITLEHVPGTIDFVDVRNHHWQLDDATVVTSREVPHCGNTVGYRVDRHGRSVAYISDHQQPLDGSGSVAPGALELADGVDLLIHDAQYTDDEFELKRTWGHCTLGYALHVAREAGAKRLALFHHDPSHDDDRLDQLRMPIEAMGERYGIEVICAAEGMSMTVGTSAMPILRAVS
jgi:phosphoribosyl 1,2-cyclic phosphodiesterase